MSSISIIIPTYQHGSTIGDCLDSVLGQTLPPEEIIVVNDGSTDNTAEILQSYKNRIMIIEQENSGSNAARNLGFDVSKGESVIFCDADVVMEQEMLEKMAKTLDQNPKISYVYSGFKYGWKNFSSYNFDPGRLRKMNYIHTTSLMRREAFPGFDPSIKRLQDWDVWLTMLENNRLGMHLPEILFQIIGVEDRRGISQWRPSFMFKIPWKSIGWKPEAIRNFEEAKEIILHKHQL